MPVRSSHTTVCSCHACKKLSQNSQLLSCLYEATCMTGADCYVRASYRHDRSRLLCESFLQAWQEQTVMWKLLTSMTGADCYVKASYRHERSRLLCESFLQAWQEQTVMWELLTGMTGADCYVKASYMHDMSRLLCESLTVCSCHACKKLSHNSLLLSCL
jgi:transcriptional regulator of met regulon